MNQSYGRLVSRAAIAATAMASLLLLIKIFAWWYTGSVSILAALVDSLVAPLSVVNALIVACSYRKEEAISKTFANLEEIWDEYGVYEKVDDLGGV